MGYKKLVWISLFVGIIAIVFSAVALVNCCPTQDLQFDYMGVIVGVLALLVTALIGAQVGQYVFVDRKIEKISSKISKKITQKIAQKEVSKVVPNIAETVAKETAQSTAMEVVGGLPDDISFVLRGKDYMNSATSQIVFSEYMTAIDFAIKALEEFKKCKSKALYQTTVDDALESLKYYFIWSNNNGGYRILRGKRTQYETVLNDSHSEKLQVCLDYLARAKELDKEEDNKFANQKLVDMIKKGTEA